MTSEPEYAFEDDTGLAVTENTQAGKPRSLADGFELLEPPVTMDLWRLIIQVPFPPETYGDSDLVVPEEYREDKEFASYVGCVAGMGPLCFSARTRTQMDLKTANGCKIGDWVMFGKHAGEKFRTTDKTLWVVLSDTEILGVTDNPDAFECMVL